jgi:hypothetical protein
MSDEGEEPLDHQHHLQQGRMEHYINGVEFDESKEIEFRRYVLDASYILGGEASHMLAILQDGFVKEFIICVKYDYNDQELEPIVFLEVRSNMNVYGFGEKVYETKGNCTLEEFENVFVRRHQWRYKKELKKKIEMTPRRL